MRAHSVTTYPLLQSVVSINDDGLIADAAVMDGGATLAFESSGEFFGDVFTLSAPGDGFTNVDLIVGNSWCYCEEAIMGGDDNKWMQLDFLPKPATSALSWTTYGFWNAYDSNLKTTTDAAFVTGYITPTGSVPITGSATYSGSVVGKVYVADSSQPSGITAYGLSGNASLNANFGNRSIAGNLTNMSANSQPWNSISLLGTISGGNFTGTTTATSAPEGFASLSGSATGTFAGLFFGPKAEELGAVWSLYDGSKSALGAIGAKTGP